MEEDTRVLRSFGFSVAYREIGQSSAVSVARDFAASGHILIIGTPLFRLKIRIQEVCRIEVRAGVN